MRGFAGTQPSGAFKHQLVQNLEGRALHYFEAPPRVLGVPGLENTELNLSK